MSEMEIMVLACRLPTLRSLQRLTLKVIQYPNVSSEGCIFQLVNNLSKIETLKKFDVYFRRLSLEEQSLNKLIKSFEDMNNVQYCCFKQSLHVFRNNLNH